MPRPDPFEVAFVVEDDGGQSISSVTVDVEGKSALSDASGKASFELDSGSYQVSFSKDNYVTYNETY
ncbi:hypothetical protein [Algibacter sp. L3A6]|uniref:hypothetical protein n=1 Tax=Algibacter sp. L3A6 TaxID=2686366 RepID=UPI00131D71DA|nr:hypothetical protein [Algibacter sp. L3A6]